MVMSSQESGCRHQLGEFLKVTPSSNTFLHLIKLSRTGRSQSRMLFHSSSVLIPSGTLKFLHAIAPLIEPSLGYQIRPDSSSTPPEATSFFHWLAVILSFFTGRHVSPFPSITPFPVMATFSALRADIGDWQRRVSSPSNEVLTIGYCVWSAVNSTSAFSSRYKLMLLCSTIGPVSHSPAGTITLPPPFSATALIVLSKASVLSVIPSATAPNSVIERE